VARASAAPRPICGSNGPRCRRPGRRGTSPRPTMERDALPWNTWRCALAITGPRPKPEPGPPSSPRRAASCTPPRPRETGAPGSPYGVAIPVGARHPSSTVVAEGDTWRERAQRHGPRWKGMPPVCGPSTGAMAGTRHQQGGRIGRRSPTRHRGWTGHRECGSRASRAPAYSPIRHRGWTGHQEGIGARTGPCPRAAPAPL